MAIGPSGGHWTPSDGLLPRHFLPFGQSLPSPAQGHTPLENAAKESESKVLLFLFLSFFLLLAFAMLSSTIHQGVGSVRFSLVSILRPNPPTTKEEKKEKTLLIAIDNSPSLMLFSLFSSQTLLLSMRQR